MTCLKMGLGSSSGMDFRAFRGRFVSFPLNRALLSFFLSGGILVLVCGTRS